MPKQEDGKQMRFVNNEPEQIEIRKCQNTLIVVGAGIILFGIWTMVKTMGMLFLLRDETIAAFRNSVADIAGVSDETIFRAMVAITLIAAAVVLAVRAYIGLSAISEGRGKRRSVIYLLLTGFLIISGISSLATDFFSMSEPEQLGAFTNDQSFSAAIIEATSLIMMTQMLVSSLKIRKLAHRKGRDRDSENAA